MRHFKTPAGKVHELQFSPNGEYLYFLSVEEYKGRGYDTAEHRPSLVQRAFRADVRSGQISGTRALDASDSAIFTSDFCAVYHSVSVVKAGGDFDLRRTDLLTGCSQAIRDFNNRGLCCQALTSNGHILAAGGWDDPVHRLDVWHNVMLDPLPFGTNCLAYSPDDRTLATGHQSNGVCIWRGKVLEEQWSEPARELAWSRSGWLAWGITWGMKGQVTVVRPSSGRPPQTWASAGEALTSLALSADGTRLLTGTYCGLCAFHDTIAGQQRAAFNWDIGPIHSVAFSPDGLTCAAGGEDGRIVIWDVDI